MKVKLVKKVNEAKGTKSFYWEPEKAVDWLPGQYFYYTIPKMEFDDSRGPTRHFTVSSSPSEGNLLRLTTRIRESSGYKNSLDNLKIGDLVECEGPTGTFILDESEKDKSHIFLAGGIGITPFRCFIKYAIDNKLKVSIYLIYSNTIPEEIAFRQELEEWDKKYDFFKMTQTVTRPEESKEPWTGKKGRIDQKLISGIAEGYDKPTFWIVGPPPFTSALEEIVENLKVPAKRIRTEKFTGY